MEHGDVAGAPHRRGVLLALSEVAAVVQVDHRRRRQRRHLDPRDQLTRRGIVALDLVGEPERTGRIAAEVDVEPVGAGDVAAVAGVPQERLGGRDQQREVDVGTTGDLVVDEIDRAHRISERRGITHRGIRDGVRAVGIGGLMG